MLRAGFALACTVAAFGLLVSVEIEETNTDCGIAPAAAFSHEISACRRQGRNQLMGAIGTLGIGGLAIAWPALRRRRKRRQRIWSRVEKAEVYLRAFIGLGLSLYLLVAEWPTLAPVFLLFAVTSGIIAVRAVVASVSQRSSSD